ncbi:E3 ubiquitin-protein ligase TRIM9-like [Oppia nitens]|uniref:E3 ubiquitin-protein ligase TRIM9-like n=1 Tax=Oppia nitens TaxID=1686743 RepID=UPI0023DA258D|nr:E3 ubiquitin-protein ligase TRIM9-like [Oppia nitens]
MIKLIQTMEEELKCPVCKNFFVNPILMPCYHTLCLTCALSIQQSVNVNQHNNSSNNCNNNNNINPMTISSPTNASTYIVTATVHQSDENVHINSIIGDISATCSTSGSEISDADKVSLLSETDSGVICNSRPNSYVGTPNIQGILFPPFIQTVNSISLTCPVCHKLIYLNDNGATNLPKNRTMQAIVDKYCDTNNFTTECQLCESNPKEASVMCEQCEIYYCDTCRDRCHPQRGPLAAHKLIAAHLTKNISKTKSKESAIKCIDHSDSCLEKFCINCKIPICNTCAQENRHLSHDIQSLATICKVLKTDLSQNLHSLSEKAKTATEFIQRLKGITEKANENSLNFETEITSQCDNLIATIKARKQQLLQFGRKEKEYKLRILRDQVLSCTTKLQQTTGLIQFCIEALKDTDCMSYLQIGSSLISRVSNVEMTWHKDMNTAPWVSPEFDLTLDCQPVLLAIEQLNFSQMKPPGPPILIPDECLSENNGITVSWQPHPSSFIEAFILELDDGNNGAFREVYCGKETICTVDGLHFNSIYRIRVKAYNTSGEGVYSDVISLQTTDVAWFTLDPLSAHSDIVISNENHTFTCDSYEHRVVLANIAFSRGVHYWEITVDRYLNNADIALGIARIDVSKDKMLGCDCKGWSMYIDNKRSWFLHSDRHDSRSDGGIGVGSVIGILLNMETNELSFYVNDELQSGIAFSDLKGVFYPAFSLNRNVTITVTTGIEPPISSGSNSANESESSDAENKRIN